MANFPIPKDDVLIDSWWCFQCKVITDDISDQLVQGFRQMVPLHNACLTALKPVKVSVAHSEKRTWVLLKDTREADEVSGVILEMYGALWLLDMISNEADEPEGDPKYDIPFIENIRSALLKFNAPGLRRKMVKLIYGDKERGLSDEETEFLRALRELKQAQEGEG